MSEVLSIRLPEELNKKTEMIAQKLKRSKNWVIREVLEHYLEDLYDIEEAEKIILNKQDKLIPHEQAKREILSD
ncbi:MAG: ribbon-helix-helix domain-containing protein [Candidatus Omnitrophica bacterium]|nr:ribbon-helix-helix domain-containing protein [Candidatus Omnitrophota bacterium]